MSWWEGVIAAPWIKGLCLHAMKSYRSIEAGSWRFLLIGGFRARSLRKTRRRYAIDALDPSAQVALIGKARRGGDVGERQVRVAEHPERMLQTKLHEVLIRAHADGAAKDSREGRAELAGNVRDRIDFDRVAQMRGH